MLDVFSNPVEARGWNVNWDACSDPAATAQTRVTKQRQEGVQAEFVSPRRSGAQVGIDTLGPCPRQDAVSGTPLLQQEEEEAPRDEGLGTAGLHQAPEGKSGGVECGPREVSVGYQGAGPLGPLWMRPRALSVWNRIAPGPESLSLLTACPPPQQLQPTSGAWWQSDCWIYPPVSGASSLACRCSCGACWSCTSSSWWLCTLFGWP